MYKAVLILSLVACLGVTACSGQQSDWQKTRATNTTDAYESFLKKYPNGEFAAQAHARAKELYEERDWQKARDLDSADAYQAFLKQYPDGKWAEEARIRVENFSLAAAPTNGTSASAGTGAADAEPPATTPADKPAETASQHLTPPPVHKTVQKAAPIMPTTPRTSSTTPRTPSRPASAADAGAGSASGQYGVQLGAFKTGEAAANRLWEKLSGKYPRLFGGLSPRVSPREVATGTLYRLQVVNLSDKRANALCKSLKAHSQACEVLRPAHEG